MKPSIVTGIKVLFGDTYYDMLASRSDLYKMYRLDSQAQINQYSAGMPFAAFSEGCCKLTIPTWDPANQYKLAAPVAIGDTSIRVYYASGNAAPWANNKGIYVSNTEVMIKAASGNVNHGDGTWSFTVNRGEFSTPVNHAVNGPIILGTNSLPSPVKVPLDARPKHRYLITWDWKFDTSWLGDPVKHCPDTTKTFQLESSGIWWETRMKYDGKTAGTTYPGFDPTKHVSVVDVRSYNKMGGTSVWIPNNLDGFLCSDVSCSPVRVTDGDPVNPQGSNMIFHPNRWNRGWIEADVKDTNYTIMTEYVCDEVQNPIMILDRIPTTVRYNSSPAFTIEKFWHQFNTSSDHFLRPDFRNLTVWVRGPVVLIDPPLDWSSLRIKPV